MNPESTPTTHTVDVAGAGLYYEVRGTGPVLVLIGNPMDARAFTPLAAMLATDHTVVTTDPRGINRSPVLDPDQDVSAEVRGDDLAALIEAVGAGPAVVLGSSGGAVSALALAQRHPELVSTVIAHEPPLHSLLGDSAQQFTASDETIRIYGSGDVAGAWAKFMADANLMPPPAGDVGPAGPQLPAEPDPQSVADERFFFEHLLRPTTRWQPDLDALRSGPARILVGVGLTSGGQICDRTSSALAAGLGLEPTYFPGGHVGFAEDPAGFAARLRALLPVS